MHPLKVGCVNYINALPIYYPFDLKIVPSDAFFVYHIPSRLNHMVRNKQLDIALTSSIEYLEGDYQLIPSIGITSRQKVLSVNLYTRIEPSELGRKKVGLTDHSATSVALLKILFKHFWGATPDFEVLNRNTLNSYHAFLLIGNEALEHLTFEGFQTIDLAAIWFEMTQLPFVFAVFIAGQATPPKALELFHQALLQALCWSASHRESIYQQAHRDCSLPLCLIKEYFSHLNYILADQEMESLTLFKKLKESL